MPSSINELYTSLDGVIQEMEGMAEGDFEGSPEDFATKSTDLSQKAEVIKASIKSRQDLLAKSEATKSYMGEQKKVSHPFVHGKPEGEQRNVKSLGEMFTGSDAYKSFRRGIKYQQIAAELDGVDPANLKAILDSSTVTSIDKRPGIVLQGVQGLTISDLIAQGNTTSSVVRYIRENSFTPSAAGVLEGGLKPGSAFDIVEVDAPVRKIAVTGKVTDEMFADHAEMSTYLNSRLSYMVGWEKERQLLVGTGAAPELKGITVTPGVQTLPLGTYLPADVFFAAMTRIRVASHYEPDGIVLHPYDWEQIRLQKSTTNDYVFGSPINDVTPRAFGLPVVLTTAVAAGTALVGAFRMGTQAFNRTGITIEATSSNEDDFKRNLIAIRAEVRLALAVYQPAAFCLVTGLATTV